MKLLTSNSKLQKDKSYYTVGLQLAPSNESGLINVCKFATKGCRKACIFTSGRGKMPNVISARIERTNFFALHRHAFLVLLKSEIEQENKKADKVSAKLAVRPNVFSDVRWEKERLDGKNIFELFPEIQFYDYTKDYQKMLSFLRGELPANYHLTFSRAETPKSHEQTLSILQKGGNVAVVFRKSLPETWQGYKVIDGDKSDLRFLDPANCVVGLLAKGDGRKDKSGFVID